jgi:hypothetical protein
MVSPRGLESGEVSLTKTKTIGGVIEAAEVRTQEFKAGSFSKMRFKTEFLGSGEKKARLPACGLTRTSLSQTMGLVDLDLVREVLDNDGDVVTERSEDANDCQCYQSCGNRVF